MDVLLDTLVLTDVDVLVDTLELSEVDVEVLALLALRWRTINTQFECLSYSTLEVPL